MKTPAFSYLRVSGKSQILGDGFPRQRLTINEYCEQNGVEIQREFVEKGVSGTKDAFDREALTEMFIALKANDVKLVLCERADRLARDLMISEILLGEFRKIGVKVVSAECGTELTVEDNDPTKKLIRQVLGAISEWEKSVIVQKLRAARMRIKLSKGKCEGRKAYGTTPEEKAIISQMQAFKQVGYTMAEIASRLNLQGVKPKTPQRDGKASIWHPTTVQRILARI
jgi:DNA invertase Pin-like site-specific DNA recombinase